MAFGYTGNVRDVADSHTEMFGGPAYVAASLFGDNLWTNIGLVMRVSITRNLFSQANKNEIMQTMGKSNFQAFSGGEISLTLRRFEAEQMAALYPGITHNFLPSGDKRGAIGHNTIPKIITPIGLHIRPQYSANETANDPNCWWMPAAVAGDELGEFIFKLENSRDATEDFTLTFEASLITEDYTPGTPQNIHQACQILFRGDSRHAVTNTWETGLPFGYVKGTPGRVESFGVKTSKASGFTLEWTAPSASYVNPTYPITSYKIQHRPAGSTASFTELSLNTLTTLEQAISGLTVGTTYEVRVAGVSSAGTGQFAAMNVTPT
ncbi:MAG: fibronectin type III domain-containing protein [Candidatus Poribacteria bacterium]|nr:fibronectin type III domain-containing protein [Candidatus Poribacteria bacterium]